MRDHGGVELTVLLPCLDEAETIETCVAKARAAIEGLGIAGEVLVVDNGSADRSVELARAAGARVVHGDVRGYGAALRTGIEAARGDLVVMGDADDSYDFSAIAPFVERLRAGDDLVVGNRFAGGIAPGAMPALHRYLGNPVLSLLGRLLFRTPVRDFHCGLRGVRRDAALALDLRTTGMEFASEMIVKASLSGQRISEVPTTLSPDGRSRAPHLRTWHDGWRHLRFLLLYSPRWLFLGPGLALMVAGTVSSAVLLAAGPVGVGRVRFDVQTLVFTSLAVIIGLQAVALALFSTVFAVTEGLVPHDARAARVERAVARFRLEHGLLAGAVLAGAGLVGSLVALARWRARDFGDLRLRESIRLVIPSATALAVGVEVVLLSFFLSVLGLRRR